MNSWIQSDTEVSRNPFAMFKLSLVCAELTKFKLYLAVSSRHRGINLFQHSIATIKKKYTVPIDIASISINSTNIGANNTISFLILICFASIAKWYTTNVKVFLGEFPHGEKLTSWGLWWTVKMTTELRPNLLLNYKKMTAEPLWMHTKGDLLLCSWRNQKFTSSYKKVDFLQQCDPWEKLFGWMSYWGGYSSSTIIVEVLRQPVKASLPEYPGQFLMFILFLFIYLLFNI